MVNTINKIENKLISSEFPFESKFLEVLGSKIHYIDEGEGDPLLFIHGNPTSSYLWRNIIPYLSGQGRCIALDLIGMGKSDKPDLEYGFHDSYKYLDAFVEKLKLKNVTLILHDWGSGLGFHYANMHRSNIKAIAFMEAMYQAPNFDAMQLSVKIPIKMVRSRLFGSFLVKRMNMFINKMLPDMILRDLTAEEFEYYAQPYQTVKSREPLLAWPRAITMKGKPEDIDALIKNYHNWLVETEIPKLFFYVSPGVGIKEGDVAIIKNTFKNLTSIDLGEGLHFIQEDYPHEIGLEISNWYSKLNV